jgi:hypothetical protein
MSDTPAQSPRPVSLVTILAILGSFTLFLFLVYLGYLSHRPAPAQNLAAELLPDNMKWESTPEGRAGYLAELRAKQQKQATTYAWVDQKAGIVQLPIDRAMEMTVQEYNTKK